MITITIILLLSALGTAIASLAGRCPAGVSCLLLSIALLLAHIPLG